VDSLENNILRLQQEVEVFKSKETDVDGILATKTREFTEKYQERDTHFSSLQEELEAAKSEAVEAAERLEIEKESFDSCTKELTEKVEELTEKVQLLESQLKMEDDEAAQAAQIYKDDGEGKILSVLSVALLKPLFSFVKRFSDCF
jgi:outer membrane murein-binding lipoprotein Lpp